jgi:hypothetical protein
LNIDLLDWDSYVLIRSVSYAADGGHSNIILDVAMLKNKVVGTKVHELNRFLEDKGWSVSCKGDTITIKLELPEKVESIPYSETGDYDNEETNDA